MNETIYNYYSIESFPCHFFSLKAVDKYNGLIEKFCKKLPQKATDLRIYQKIIRRLYIILLDVLDAIWGAK